ncbi:hypothetical protein [Candidatus Stoquefichus massiliensis]|uniref:hypothetical protein n=1 Tax=Candidatus Stoquefichus massiliensis TaxID=1470350 RepID=UPI000488EFB5|nr:hypothetical protein [Candidatus Stoquefichus massiliensis]
MNNLRIQLKDFLQDHFLVMNTLDDSTKEKQREIVEFLSQIEEMQDNAHKKIEDLSQNYSEMIKTFHLLYDQLKQVDNDLEKNQKSLQNMTIEINKLGIDIKTYDGKYSDIVNQIKIFQQQLSNKEKEYNQAVGMCFIPFAGFHYMSKCADIRNNQIPLIKRNIDKLIADRMTQEKQKEEANMRNASLVFQMKTTKILINDMISKKQVLTQQMTQKKDEITSSVQQMVYYSILQEKLNNFLTRGDTLDQVLTLLDQEPDMIHYEDQTYFDILKAFYDNPDDQVFERYIMDAQNQIF